MDIISYYLLLTHNIDTQKTKSKIAKVWTHFQMEVSATCNH